MRLLRPGWPGARWWRAWYLASCSAGRGQTGSGMRWPWPPEAPEAEPQVPAGPDGRDHVDLAAYERLLDVVTVESPA